MRTYQLNIVDFCDKLYAWIYLSTHVFLRQEPHVWCVN